MLVIMHNRNIQHGLQALLHFEAARRGYVLKLDRSKGWGNGRHRLDDLIGILRIQQNWDTREADQSFHQHGFAFHDWHRCQGADISQAQHCCPICDDGNHVADAGVQARKGGVVCDLQADLRHAGSIDASQCGNRINRVTRTDGDLALVMLPGMRREEREESDRQEDAGKRQGPGEAEGAAVKTGREGRVGYGEKGRGENRFSLGVKGPFTPKEGS